MYLLSRIGSISLLISATLALSACNFPPRLYRMDVRQGNYITSEDASKLKVGMTKEAVQHILGTPTLTHFFEQERWDYYSYLRPGNGDPIQEKRISVFFKGDKVVRIIKE